MKLPQADAWREDMARQIFAAYMTMSPEEWAARFAHTVGASSFADYQYHDSVLHAWIHRLHQILKTPGAVEQYRLHFLSAAERAVIAADEAEAL